MYLGIDCGTQSTKAVVADRDTLDVLGEGSAAHTLQSGDNGRREQNPGEWITAFETAFSKAITHADIDARAIRAIGISGQQHSLVAVDRHNLPVYPAKLWCDTETAPENADIIAELGGPAGCLETLGVVPQPGFTISKVAWLRRYHPEAYRCTDGLLLPHDYLNLYLTGMRTAEAGDASGTGYFDTRGRVWRPDILTRVAPELDPAQVLPELVPPGAPAGLVRSDIAERLGLRSDVTVSAGGGDNMMSAIGTGNIEPGIVTVSLGSSGTVFAYNDVPAIADDGQVANFCASNGGWLPLICTMNVTAASSLVASVFDMTTADFGSAIESASIGSGGVTALPFFNGERVPPLPHASGSYSGLTPDNFTMANLCRATVESSTYGLRYGLDLLRNLGISPGELHLVGGGARSAIWRQIVADVTNVPVVGPVIGEAAALGAAIQACWSHQQQCSESNALSTICNTAVKLNPEMACTPIASNVTRYREYYDQYQDALRRQYPQPEQTATGWD